MINEPNRREFIAALCMGTVSNVIDPLLNNTSVSDPIMPIRGSWFEFQHHATVEGVDWNSALAQFTAEQWDAKVKEMAEVGIEYLVLMATAVYYRSFYETKIYPKWKLACVDPLEAVLTAAD